MSTDRSANCTVIGAGTDALGASREPAGVGSQPATSRTTPMHDGRVDFEQLERLTRLTAPDAIGCWLGLRGIACALDERGLPWTTLAAIRRGQRRGGRTPTSYPCADLALEICA
jgi:hypothetical protein